MGEVGDSTDFWQAVVWTLEVLLFGSEIELKPDAALSVVDMMEPPLCTEAFREMRWWASRSKLLSAAGSKFLGSADDHRRCLLRW